MKQTILAGAVAVALCVAAPFAQDQPAPVPTPTPAQPAHKVFVLTGCLETGVDPAATFRLTDASAIGRAPVGASEAGAVGTSGQNTSGQKGSYELRPVSGVNAQGLNADALKAHLGRRVEVIVRPLDTPAAGPSDGQIVAARPTEPAPERFSVTEIKRVTGSCS